MPLPFRQTVRDHLYVFWLALLTLALADTAGAWRLLPDASWHRLTDTPAREAPVVSLQGELLKPGDSA